MSEYVPYLISGFVGIGLAAATGFRIFMPFFFISLASYLDWIPVHESWIWLATLPTVIGTGIAMLLEIIAYYLPFVDNILDTIAVPLATVAGSLLFASQFTELGAFAQWSLAIIAGGGTATAIGAGFAGTRATSSATTAGVGNPIITTVETIGATIMSILAIFAPIIAIIAVFILLYLGFRYGRKLWNKLVGKKTTIISD